MNTGGSVLSGVQADVYWTGEMQHHDILAAVGQGTSVILCEYGMIKTSNTYTKIR